MPESTELAIAKPELPIRTSRASSGRPNAADRRRWFMFKQRVTHEEIAKREGVKLESVIKSIDRMEAYKAQTSNEMVDMRMNEIVLNVADKTERSLTRALDARHVIRRPSAKNPDKMVVVSSDPDHKTQIEAAREIRQIAERTIPKGGGVNIALQQNQSVSAETAHHRNFEERIRAARAQRGLSNGMEVEDAEFENVDESAEQFDDEGEDETSEES